MKKNYFKILFWNFLLLIFLLACNDRSEINFTNNPNFVSENQAMTLLQKFHRTNGSSAKNVNINRKVKELKPIMDENNEQLFYIANYENGGFVILSADKRISPVLAYSDENSFRTNADEYSTGLIEWLSITKEAIQRVKQKNSSQNPNIKKEWDYLERTGEVNYIVPPDTGGCQDTVEEVGPLLSTIWHQGCGFNDYMPSLNCATYLPCGKAYAGCVPIAIAQVMKFHQFPSNYNWNDMPNNYATNSTALLIKDIHNALTTNFFGSSIPAVSYDCDGTGVDKDYNTAGLFVNKFGYSSATQGDYNYQTVIQQLRWNRPVILGGGRKSGWWIFSTYKDGHMWVCDGFRQSYIYSEDCSMGWGYLSLHMNWGWENGYENGWYAFNNFNPDTYTFNYQVKMVYNIKP